MKNVFAVAAGIIDGMKLGDNPKAALMTRAICEMGKLGESLGGEKSTFAGLSGVGDLIVTCCSGHSRNRYVGEELGKGRKLPEILRATTQYCEVYRPTKITETRRCEQDKAAQAPRRKFTLRK